MPDHSLSDFADKIVEAMRALTRGFGKKHSNELCRGKITMPQFIILDFLSSRSGAKMRDVATFLEISTAAVTGIVDRLQKSGYLDRLPDSRDRRIIHLKLSRKGNALVEKIHKERRQMLISMFSRISQSEREEYLRILTKIKNAILGNNHDKP
ncbi:MAG: MarR family transcriptional regulator [Candidatus Aureabacteria bacterium]|nr:MarR family transcriptional regulator [Candidatus Auribacterota bacterium]